MNALDLHNFEFEGQSVRMHVEQDEPWFVLSDVCRVLEIRNPTQAAARLDDDERSMLNIGRQGEAIIINESGLYSLILTSRKAAARRFKKWVTAEVLPTLRRTGVYMMAPDDEDLPSLADGKLFGMRVAKVNAAARIISVANAIYGPEAARALWESEPGLPKVGHKAIGALAGTPADDPNGCFRHLLRYSAGKGQSIGQVLALAVHDAVAARRLPDLGMRADPPGHKGYLAVLDAHPFLSGIFAETQWADEWRTALLALSGAKIGRGVVLIPKHTVTAHLARTRH